MWQQAVVKVPLPSGPASQCGETWAALSVGSDGKKALLMPTGRIRYPCPAPGQLAKGKSTDWVTIPCSFAPAEAGFLDDRVYDSTALGPGYDRPFQFDSSVREPKTIQLYKHLNLKSCVWTFDAYYDMTELIDVCGGSVTADFQVGSRGPVHTMCHGRPSS